MTVDLDKLNKMASAANPSPPVVSPPVEATTVSPPVEPHTTVKAGSGLKHYRVQLEGEPAVDIRDCHDRLDAQEKYMKTLGINSTTRKFTYTEIE